MRTKHAQPTHWAQQNKNAARKEKQIRIHEEWFVEVPAKEEGGEPTKERKTKTTVYNFVSVRKARRFMRTGMQNLIDSRN